MTFQGVFSLTVVILACFSSSGITAQDAQHVPFRIIEAPTNQKVAASGTVSFVCRAEASSTPTFSWSKDGMRVEPSRRYSIIEMPGVSVLRIERARQASDTGVYHCRCEVAAEGLAMHMEATLEVYESAEVPPGYPLIGVEPTLGVVEAGRDALRVCEAHGDPDPQIRWFKDGIPVDMSDDRFTLYPVGYLQIKATKQSDEGRYECQANNSVGMVLSYGAMLYVRVRRVPPRFVVEPESHVTVRAGGNLNLTCEAVGAPMPYLMWLRGSVALTNEEEKPLGSSVLQLTDLQESATFTCQAESELGVIRTSSEVSVIREETPSPELPCDEVGRFQVLGAHGYHWLSVLANYKERRWYLPEECADGCEAWCLEGHAWGDCMAYSTDIWHPLHSMDCQCYLFDKELDESQLDDTPGKTVNRNPDCMG